MVTVIDDAMLAFITRVSEVLVPVARRAPGRVRDAGPVRAQTTSAPVIPQSGDDRHPAGWGEVCDSSPVIEAHPVPKTADHVGPLRGDCREGLVDFTRGP